MFNSEDQLRLELKKTDRENKTKQSIQSEQLEKNNKIIGTNSSSQRLHSNDIFSFQNLKPRNSSHSYAYRNEDFQQKQAQSKHQQKKYSVAYENGNISNVLDEDKAENQKVKQQSYSQTLRNYKWISYLPKQDGNSCTIKSQKFSITPKDNIKKQEQNYYTPVSSKKVSISCSKTGISNSAVFVSPNLPHTPHERVMRIKNKQINLQVQRQFNNLIFNSHNNFVEQNFEPYNHQLDEIKNNSVTQNQTKPTSSISLEQIIKTKGSTHTIMIDSKTENIDIDSFQKTPMSLIENQQNQIDTKEQESSSQKNQFRFLKQIARNGRSTPVAQQNEIKSVEREMSKQDIQENSFEKYREQYTNSRKSSGIQNAAFRAYKRGSNQDGRVKSPVIYNIENLEQSPMQRNTTNRSFYKNSFSLHKQVKLPQKKQKSFELEEILKNEIAKLDKIDLTNLKILINCKDENLFSATPKSICYDVHRSKDTYRPIKISKSFREQFKNVHLQQKNDNDNSGQFILNNSQLINKQITYSKIKPNSSKHNQSNASDNQLDASGVQIVQAKQATSDQIENIKNEIFQTNFPCKIQSNEFRFSKQNFKRKNNTSPKKHTFKL